MTGFSAKESGEIIQKYGKTQNISAINDIMGDGDYHIEMSKNKIENADFLLVGSLNKMMSGMQIYFARTLNKPVVSVDPDDSEVCNLWFLDNVTKTVVSVGDFFKYLSEF